MFILITDSCVMPPYRDEISEEQALRISEEWLESGDDAEVTFKAGELESAHRFEGGHYDLEHTLFRVAS